MVEIPSQDWEEFLSQYPHAHFLQSAPWGGFKAHFGWEVSRLIHQGNGVQILFKKLPLGFRWAYIPKGPLGSHWDLLWPQIDAECRRKKAAFLKIEPDGWAGEDEGLADWFRSPNFLASSHKVQPARTMVVNLDGTEDEILSRMKQKTRYNIRLANRKGVVVRPSQQGSNDVDRFYDLMQLTGVRDAFGIHTLEYYQKAYEMFAPDGLGELFLAEYDHMLLAGLMVFAFGSRAWYLFGASSNQHRNLMAPYALQWESMRWARDKGCLEYDLWGVPDEDMETLEAEFMQRSEGLWGVYRFKRGFGGEIRRSVGTWDRVYSPILYYFYRLWVKKTQT